MNAINKIYNKLYFVSLTFFIAFICLSGCKKNDDTSTDGNALVPLVDVINAGQTFGPLDVYFNSNVVYGNLLYGQQTGYIAVSPITYNVAFNVSSTTNTVGTGSFTFVPGAVYSIYFTDDESVVSITEDRTRPQTGKARISFVHLSTLYNTGPLDVYTTGGSQVAAGLYYKNSSSYVDVDPSITSFSVRAGGTTTNLLNMQVSLIANHVYTVYITGAPGRTLDYHLLTRD